MVAQGHTFPYVQVALTVVGSARAPASKLYEMPPVAVLAMAPLHVSLGVVLVPSLKPRLRSQACWVMQCRVATSMGRWATMASR